jgi:hypothetical protein
MKEPDFELSADMRLLELQRGALGLPTPERTAWESAAGRILPLGESTGDDPVAQGAILHVEAAAHPPGGVIPGAVVTLSLSVSNEGASAANGLVAGAPLPGGASYRAGSFVWNGRSSFDEVAEAFLGAGLDIGSLGPGERASFQWKIGVKLGVKPLLVAPHVRASNAPVLGARPLAIDRKTTAAGPFASELERAVIAQPHIPVDISAPDLPIYELDSEEEIVTEAAFGALSSAAPPPSETPNTAPVALAAPEPEPERMPVAAPVAPDAVRLYGRFDRATVAFFERAFHGTKPPTILQHCILSGALACSTEAGDRNDAQLKRHIDAQAQVLHRITLHEKLGKKEPIAEYAGELLAQLDQLRPAIDGGPPVLSKEVLTLSTELSQPTIAVLQRIAEGQARWDFVKARQFTLALQAERVDCPGLAGELDVEIRAALRYYAQTSVGSLQRIFVRIRIDRTTAVLQQTDPALDTAARALVDLLKRALECA